MLSTDAIFLNIVDPQIIESTDVQPNIIEGWLYISRIF